MSINKEDLKQMLLNVSFVWKENHSYLSNIDSRFGDGDHGVTINKIALLIEKCVNEWTDQSMYDFFSDLGDSIMAIGGGSAGPLYGTMIGGLGLPLQDKQEIDGGLLKEMFEESLSSMREISNAKVGDKTMMDALIPAVEAASMEESDIFKILKAAEKAAQQGAKESEQYISKFGRARSYKEKTIGTPDAGAVSTALFFNGLAKER